jgi:hypothetical protein
MELAIRIHGEPVRPARRNPGFVDSEVFERQRVAHVRRTGNAEDRPNSVRLTFKNVPDQRQIDLGIGSPNACGRNGD